MRSTARASSASATAASCRISRTRAGARPRYARPGRSVHDQRLKRYPMSVVDEPRLSPLKALRRNGLRSVLTLLGITIGVGAVLTMVAVGNGARASIEDQVVAAGMNVITVVAGNYRMKGEDGGGGVADHQAWLDAGPRGRGRRPHDGLDDIALVASASRRRSDGEAQSSDRARPAGRFGRRAGRGGDADAGRCPCDSDRDRRHPVRRGRRPRVGPRGVGQSRWFTRLHGTESELPLIRRSWAWKYGRFFIDARIRARRAGRRARQRRLRQAVQAGHRSDAARSSTIWNQPFRVVGVVVGHELDGSRRRSATTSSTRCTCRSRRFTGCSI